MFYSSFSPFYPAKLLCQFHTSQIQSCHQVMRIQLQRLSQILFRLLCITKSHVTKSHQEAAMCTVLSGKVFLEDQQIRVRYCKVIHLYFIIDMCFSITDQLIESGVRCYQRSQFPKRHALEHDHICRLVIVEHHAGWFICTSAGCCKQFFHSVFITQCFFQ